MAKLSKHNKRVLIIVGIFCITILTIGIMLEIKTNKERIEWSPDKTVGMTDKIRKQIFWDLVELQDSFVKKHPYDTQKQEDAYKIIADRYDVMEFVVKQIVIRGVKENWPKPPFK